MLEWLVREFGSVFERRQVHVFLEVFNERAVVIESAVDCNIGDSVIRVDELVCRPQKSVFDDVFFGCGVEDPLKTPLKLTNG
jgi:hypothetical protein